MTPAFRTSGDTALPYRTAMGMPARTAGTICRAGHEPVCNSRGEPLAGCSRVHRYASRELRRRGMFKSLVNSWPSFRTRPTVPVEAASSNAVAVRVSPQRAGVSPS
jgi:hypothetical protein